VCRLFGSLKSLYGTYLSLAGWVRVSSILIVSPWRDGADDFSFFIPFFRPCSTLFFVFFAPFVMFAVVLLSLRSVWCS